MKVAYFDCPSGASGDMILGALFDAGVDPAELERGLASLAIERFRIETEKRTRGGIGATGVRVIVEEKARRRGFPEIAEAIGASELPSSVKDRAIEVFRLLGEAEAAVHRIPLERVHFHEVGAVDAIVDVAGALLGLHLLGIEEVRASVPATGTGFVRAAHGLLPLPAPAVAEILKGRPLRFTDVEGELLTPTGAALLAGLTESFGPPPLLRIERIGYGAGTADRPEMPNLLRLFIGEESERLAGETVLQIESDVDDVPAELIGHLYERALAEGALDLVVLPALMKKNRPGHRISLLASPSDREKMARLLMEETGTLGVRILEVPRAALPREVVRRTTRFGAIRYKRSELPGGRVRLSPEYEDCAAVARARNLPFLEVWEAVRRDGEENE
ncbi:MAG: nickel pincer cofactor biosynthesis protein LarC [Candidatus Eisenbacteria bacterium]|nr:nickel pincer cofactor biosynthesis protein LarC [Candidatus Eisenbacteria bacterium]